MPDIVLLFTLCVLVCLFLLFFIIFLIVYFLSAALWRIKILYIMHRIAWQKLRWKQILESALLNHSSHVMNTQTEKSSQQRSVLHHDILLNACLSSTLISDDILSARLTVEADCTESLLHVGLL